MIVLIPWPSGESALTIRTWQNVAFLTPSSSSSSSTFSLALSLYLNLSVLIHPSWFFCFSFLYKDYLFLFNWDRVSHAAQHLKTRSSRTFRPALSIVRLRSFILFFHVSQTSRLLNVSLLETAQPLVNVTFRPNNSRDSRLGYTKKKKKCFQSFFFQTSVHRRTIDGCW